MNSRQDECAWGMVVGVDWGSWPSYRWYVYALVGIVRMREDLGSHIRYVNGNTIGIYVAVGITHCGWRIAAGKVT